LQISCQNEFKGYKDLLDNSPKLLWGSSIEQVKSKYPDIENFGNSYDNYIVKYIPNRKKYFHFINNQLFMVHVFCGIYSGENLTLLKKNIRNKYGIYSIEGSGIIERWLIAYSDNNMTNFAVNIENNKVRCIYIYPKLLDEYNKNPKLLDEYYNNVYIYEETN
jgi:hypothetical protein